MSLGAQRLIQAKCSARTAVRTMYENPYLARFKDRCKVPPDFYKKTTGLTGLFVNQHPHRTLTVVYSRILKALEHIPPTAAYRKYTEAIVKQRLALVQSEDSIPTLEEKIGMGQIEEVIEQAEYELEATRAIIESRAWEPLVEEAQKASGTGQLYRRLLVEFGYVDKLVSYSVSAVTASKFGSFLVMDICRHVNYERITNVFPYGRIDLEFNGKRRKVQ